jgi:hypothetical protein
MFELDRSRQKNGFETVEQKLALVVVQPVMQDYDWLACPCLALTTIDRGYVKRHSFAPSCPLCSEQLATKKARFKKVHPPHNGKTNSQIWKQLRPDFVLHFCGWLAIVLNRLCPFHLFTSWDRCFFLVAGPTTRGVTWYNCTLLSPL